MGQQSKQEMYNSVSLQTAQLIYIDAMPFTLKPLVMAMRDLQCEEHGHDIRQLGQSSRHVASACIRCQQPVIETKEAWQNRIMRMLEVRDGNMQG